MVAVPVPSINNALSMTASSNSGGLTCGIACIAGSAAGGAVLVIGVAGVGIAIAVYCGTKSHLFSHKALVTPANA